MTQLKHTARMDPGMVQLVGRSISGEVLIPAMDFTEVHNLRMRFYRLAKQLKDLNPDQPRLAHFATRQVPTAECYAQYPEYRQQADHITHPYTLALLCGKLVTSKIAPEAFCPDGPNLRPEPTYERRTAPPLDLDLTTDQAVGDENRAEGIAATLGLINDDPELED